MFFPRITWYSTCNLQMQARREPMLHARNEKSGWGRARVDLPMRAWRELREKREIRR